MSKPIVMSAAVANVMIDIFAAAERVPAGVPVRVHDDEAAQTLEGFGMIERHHLGSGIGAIVTAKGRQFVQDSIRHLRN